MRLIDVDELKEPVGSYNPVKFTSEYGYVISVEDIDHAPTVDPVKHGRWIMHPNGHGTCSNCKKCSLDIMGGVDSNFCPNCGAKMDEVSE